MLCDGMRPNAPLTTGTIVKGELFDTTVLAADQRGVTKLKFTFHRPLESESYHFFVSSPERPAYHLRFNVPPGPVDRVDAARFAQARSDDAELRTRAREQIVLFTRLLASQTASPIQADLHDPQLASDEALDRVEAWWESVGASQLLSQYAEWYQQSAGMLRERDYYFRITDFTRSISRSDLFLTGDRPR